MKNTKNKARKSINDWNNLNINQEKHFFLPFFLILNMTAFLVSSKELTPTSHKNIKSPMNQSQEWMKNTDSRERLVKNGIIYSRWKEPKLAENNKNIFNALGVRPIHSEYRRSRI